MTIYVDPLFKAQPRTTQARRHGEWWCHMMTDGDLEELHKFAESIGFKKDWFHRCSVPHYDLTPAKRKAAIAKGATEKEFEDLRPLRRAWMARWHGGKPDWE